MLQNTPQVVKNLIILNVLMYFGSGLLGDAAVPLLAGTYPGSPFFQPWQLVTHMFMHGDLGHISSTCSRCTCLAPNWSACGGRNGS